jgi:putative ABC transport system permease protein
VRNRVLVRLGVRNVGRRRARTVLIIVGLMLGTAIISSALSTGDTISYAIRSDVVEALGATDEVVARKGAPGLDAGGWAGGVSATGDVASYFRQNAVTVVRDRFGARPPVDGVAAAIVEMAAVQDVESRQTEPRVTLFGADSASTRRAPTSSAPAVGTS